MTRPTPPWPMALHEVRALDDARRAARDMIAQGTRQSHGVYPNRPLTPAMRRDAETIVRAVTRLLAADTDIRRSDR